jgi:acid phosphatase (class A)
MTIPHVASRRAARLAAACLAIAAGCAMGEETHPAADIRPGVAAGYLPQDAVPDSLVLLPPPPAEGSAALTMDREISRAEIALEGSKRWKFAGMDANLSFPWAAGAFVCALGAPVSLLNTPHLYQLLRRTMTDAAQSARAAKDRYKRPRPFMVNKAPTCTPGAEEHLAQDGAYPSGHAAIGWAWALILSEISPEQSSAILARGRAFGQSRVVCNVHWQSDVTESLVLGAATVARLHADSAFLADLDAAKAELAAARAKKQPPQRDCKVEAEALAQQPSPAP